MFARYASAIAAGSLITVSLLYAMQGLIGDEYDYPVIKRPYHELGWVLPPREKEPPRTRDLIDPDLLTDIPEVPHSAPPTTNGPGHGIPTIPVDAEPIVDGPRGAALAGWSANRDGSGPAGLPAGRGGPRA